MRGLKRPENREWDECCIIQERTLYALFFISREMKRPSFERIICDSSKSSVGKDLELCYLS